jgi:hypothetical protein
VSASLDYVRTWMRDAIAYAPAATGPGVYWRCATAPGFESLAVCPACSLRMVLRGCQCHPDGAPWTADDGHPGAICLGCGADAGVRP